MNGFYHLGQLDPQSATALVQRALAMRQGAAPQACTGRSLGLLFFNPSLRTQASFQRAAGKLGLGLVQLQANGIWGIETRAGVVMDEDRAEHIREAAAVLGRYVDVLGVRAFPGGEDLEYDFSDPILGGFQEFAGIPIVNMESARWHPCQALADWVTMEQFDVPKRGKLVLSWAWHPRALPHAVPNSTLTMACQRGMDVVLLRPKGFDLHPSILDEARSLARASGGELMVTSDRTVVEEADVVYAKSWGSLEAYGDAEREASLRAPLRTWQITQETMQAAGPEARFFHCLPVRRNVVVSDSVLEGPQSAVLEQAENRLHAQLAVLETLCHPLLSPIQAQEIAPSSL